MWWGSSLSFFNHNLMRSFKSLFYICPVQLITTRMNLLDLLPKSIESIEDVRDLLLALMRTNKLYHLDDSPYQIDCFTHEEAERVDDLMEQADIFTREYFNKENDRCPNAALWEDVIIDVMGFGWVAFRCHDVAYVYDYNEIIKCATISEWADIVRKCTYEDGDMDQDKLTEMAMALPDVGFN